MAFRVFVHRATDFRSVVLKVTSRGRAKQRCTANSALDTEEVVRDVNRFSRKIRLKALKTKLKSSLRICCLLRQIAKVDSWPGDQVRITKPPPPRGHGRAIGTPPPSPWVLFSFFAYYWVSYSY